MPFLVVYSFDEVGVGVILPTLSFAQNVNEKSLWVGGKLGSSTPSREGNIIESNISNSILLSRGPEPFLGFFLPCG